MARLVTTNRRIATGVVNPVSTYSRVVSCVVALKEAATEAYAVTPVVGQRVWLLKVTCFFTPMVANPTKQHFFRLYTGTTKISAAAEMHDQENVLPLVSPGFTDEPWTYSDGVMEMSWDMRRLYTGAGRWFGILAEVGPWPPREICVSFEISEG